MVRTNDSRVIVSDKVVYAEFAGKSTDEKPTLFGRNIRIVNGERVTVDVGLSTGSVFIEVDTGDVYLFDETDSSWKKVGE